MSDHHESGSPAGDHAEAAAGGAVEHLNIKVTDNNNEVFFKIKRSTKLEKLMNAFCERQGKNPSSVRFLFEGQRVQPTDTPDTVCSIPPPYQQQRGSDTSAAAGLKLHLLTGLQLEMQDSDTLEVHQEQVGGAW